MFFKKINEKIDKVTNILERSNIIELSYLVGSKKEILKRNLIAGIARGVGIGIGVAKGIYKAVKNFTKWYLFDFKKLFYNNIFRGEPEMDSPFLLPIGLSS